MPENFFPKSEDIYRGDRDAIGFEVVYVSTLCVIHGVQFQQTVAVRRVHYDQLQEDLVCLEAYVRGLVVESMIKKLSVTMAVQQYGH